MNRTPVSSSNLRSIGYDSQSQVLEVEFTNGGLYQYVGVPEYVHQSLMNASSHGVYFSANIRNVYLFRKIR
jgi:hypothetical protein